MHLTYIRRILYRGTFRLAQNITNKNIMTTPRNMQELLEDLKGNPYYDKYAQKIAKLQEAAPEDFTARVVEVANKKTAKPETPVTERQYSQLLNPKKKISELLETPTQQLEESSLEKIMKIDLIHDKTAEEIKTIWEQYHVQKECVSATIPAKEFEKMQEKARQFPTFLFPLPRSQGYEFIMCQFEKTIVHFTPLLYYQVHKENAPECLTITHYTEFQDKGIILMRGEYDKNVVNAKEAQCLANQLQLYYAQNDPEKNRLLQVFTHKPDDFKHSELLKQIESLSL